MFSDSRTTTPELTPSIRALLIEGFYGHLFGGGEPSVAKNFGNTAFVTRAVLSAAARNDIPVHEVRVTVLPTARVKAESFAKAVNWATEFFAGFGITAHIMHRFNETPTSEDFDNLAQAHLIYIPGGDTLAMVQLWDDYGITAQVWEAIYRGVEFCGLSAGMMFPGEFLYTDSDSYRVKEGEPYHYRLVPNELQEPRRGRGFWRVATCPHASDRAFDYTHLPELADSDATRRDLFVAELDELMSQLPLEERLPGLALDADTALVFSGESDDVLVIGRGRCTLHLWSPTGELEEHEYTAGQSFALELIAA